MPELGETRLHFGDWVSSHYNDVHAYTYLVY